MKASLCFYVLASLKLISSLPLELEGATSLVPRYIFFNIAPGIETVSLPVEDSLRPARSSVLILGDGPGSLDSGQPQPVNIPVRNEGENAPTAIVLPGSDPENNLPATSDGEPGSGNGNDNDAYTEEEIIDGSGLPDEGSGNPKPIIFFPSNNPRPNVNLEPVVEVFEPDLRCNISQGKIYFGDRCQNLLSDTPCGPEMWLLVTEFGEPFCKIRPCNKGQLLYQNQCVDINDTSVCGINEILYVDFTGEVYCDCLQKFIYDKGTSRCYAEHQQGSCPFGQILEVSSENSVQCVLNPCQHEDFIYNPTTKLCYKKLYKGPCFVDKGNSLIFNENRTAQCVSVHNRNIFEVPALTSCPAGSKRNYLGVCQRVLRLGPGSPFSYRVPSQHVSQSRYAFCPTGYTRYPDGSCKKPSSLLGR